MWKIRAIGNNYEIINQVYDIVAVGTKENLNLFEQIVNEHNTIVEAYIVMCADGYRMGCNDGYNARYDRRWDAKLQNQ